MVPSPQLKLNLVNLSGEKTKPTAPKNPRFPLDAPSKKIVVEEELIHICLKALALPRKCQGELTGLTQTIFLVHVDEGPSQDKNAEGGDEEDERHPTDSAINNLMLLATN